MAKHFSEPDPIDAIDPVDAIDPIDAIDPDQDVFVAPVESSPYDDASQLKTHPKIRKKWPLIAAAAVVVLVAAIVFSALHVKDSVKLIQSEAKAAISYAEQAMDAFESQDMDAVRESAEGLGKHAQIIKREVNSPMWLLASLAPKYGSDVRSVRALGNMLADISEKVTDPIVQNPDLFELSNIVSDGTINGESVRGLLDYANGAVDAVSRAKETLDSLPAANIAQLDDAVQSAKEKMDAADEKIGEVKPLLSYAPDILGFNGKKTYLILAQNNAERHATGGFVGNVGRLTADNGAIEIDDFKSVYSIFKRDGVSVGATDEEIEVFGRRVDDHSGDHNLIPDYQRVAELYVNTDKIINDEEPDGVLCFDVVFVQRILGLVGGIDTSYGVTVDGTNATSVLLNKCLFWWKPKKCDKFYNEVAKLTIAKLFSSAGDIKTDELMDTIMTSAEEGRCLAWLSNEEANEYVKNLGFGWEMPHDATKPINGIYTNDTSVSKASYYLELTTQINDSWQNEDGSTSYNVTATYTNHMDRTFIDEGTAKQKIPRYVWVNYEGGWGPARSVGDLQEDIYIMAPEGGHIENMAYTRENSLEDPAFIQETPTKQSFQGLESWYTHVRIDAGESIVYTYTVVTSPEAKEPLAFRTTPDIPPEIAYWDDPMEEVQYEQPVTDEELEEYYGDYYVDYFVAPAFVYVAPETPATPTEQPESQDDDPATDPTGEEDGNTDEDPDNQGGADDGSSGDGSDDGDQDPTPADDGTGNDGDNTGGDDGSGSEDGNTGGSTPGGDDTTSGGETGGGSSTTGGETGGGDDTTGAETSGGETGGAGGGETGGAGGGEAGGEEVETIATTASTEEEAAAQAETESQDV